VPWRRVRFKDQEVLARCNAQGELTAQGGRVEIRYRANDARAYQAALRNLTPLADGTLVPDAACKEIVETKARATRSSSAVGSAPAKAPDGAVIAYADGACSGNPGPAGVGIVIVDGKSRRELSRYLGQGTNNIAELTAIELAVEAIGMLERPVRIYTDSQYAIGVLTKGWKAKANQELVARVRKLLAPLPDLALHYVRGHSGIPLNERADALAVEAVQRRELGAWVQVLG
jgi:ribonuclease HI